VEIFGEDGDVYDVDTSTGEVIDRPPEAKAIVDQAHAAAARRQQEIAEIDRQRKEEGLL
jgi:hypothetical protein